MKYAITGGSMGIGAETVNLLIEAGAEVTVFDIQKPQRDDVSYVSLDLNNLASIADSVDAVETGFDGVGNIAGVPPKADNAKACLAINALGTVAFTKAMLAKLNKGASVVSVASKAGAGWENNIETIEALLACRSDQQLEDFIAQSKIDATQAYLLSKQAVIYRSKLAAGRHIGSYRFNTVSPSAVDTRILDDFMNAFGEQAKKNLAVVGRTSTALEIAQIVAFLIQDKSSWINGIDVMADGGMAAASLASADS